MTGNRLLDRLKNNKRPAPAQQPPAPPVLGETSERHEAPWGTAGCPACAGSGWTAKGEPCRICLGMSKFDLSTVTLTGPFQFAAGEKAPEEPKAAPEPEEAPAAPAQAEAPSAPSPAAPKPSLLDMMREKKAGLAPAPEPMAPKGEDPDPPLTVADLESMETVAAEPVPAPAKPEPAKPAAKKDGRGRPKLTTITITIKTSDERLLDRLARIAEALNR